MLLKLYEYEFHIGALTNVFTHILYLVDDIHYRPCQDFLVANYNHQLKTLLLVMV